jgi:signal transduction histidine kinase
MSKAAQPRFASRTERTIAVSRVVLAATSLFAIWLDPAEPARYVAPTYSLHAIYVLYALAIMGVMWNRPTAGRLPVILHVADIALFSIFQYLTLGPSSPFFIYYVFSLFCAALRWGPRWTLANSIFVVISYLIMGGWMSRTLGPTEWELNRFIIRTVYLGVTGTLLVYLGQHEARLRAEIERLARWPASGGLDAHAALNRVLAHAAHIVGAERAVALWEVGDEPWVYTASWSVDRMTVSKHGPEEFDSLVAGLDIEGVASAPFQTDRLSGRIFLSEFEHPMAELLSLTVVVAREIGTSIDQVELSEQLKEIAVREQRIGLARDLHDGVLQSLTGLRLELQSVATDLAPHAPAARDRLLAAERALAIEQRELRLFIDELKPPTLTPGETALRTRLEALRERVALEWKIPVTIRLHPESVALSQQLEQAVPMMAHEAIVNALKHAQPSRISVDVESDDRTLKLVVSDDGHGFPFQGHYEHGRLTRLNLGPSSLRERALSLGGRMTIDSGPTGSRVEIAVPVAAAVGT